MLIGSKIDFKKPRQKEWGILRDLSLASLPYGGETDSKGTPIMSFSTNCYVDALEQARVLLAGGTGSLSIQVVEFVPYDFVMQPRV